MKNLLGKLHFFSLPHSILSQQLDFNAITSVHLEVRDVSGRKVEDTPTSTSASKFKMAVHHLSPPWPDLCATTNCVCAFTCRLVHRGPASLTRPTAASRPAHRSNTWNVTSFPARNSKLPRSRERTVSRRWTLQSSDSRPPCPPSVSLPLPLPSWCADAALHRSEGRVMQS